MSWNRERVDAYLRKRARLAQAEADDINENRSEWAGSEEEFRLGMEHCMGLGDEEIDELIAEIHGADEEVRS